MVHKDYNDGDADLNRQKLSMENDALLYLNRQQLPIETYLEA